MSDAQNAIREVMGRDTSIPKPYGFYAEIGGISSNDTEVLIDVTIDLGFQITSHRSLPFMYELGVDGSIADVKVLEQQVAELLPAGTSVVLQVVKDPDDGVYRTKVYVPMSLLQIDENVAPLVKIADLKNLLVAPNSEDGDVGEN